MIWEWCVGLLGSAAIAGTAYFKKSLSGSGMAAAVALGTIMYALGSVAWFGTLIAFFVSSSLLSRWKRARKAEAERGYAKSGRRDAGQVAANGGTGLLLCIANSVWPDPFWWALYIGVMATVNADTWATEIGGASRSTPRSIVSGKPVPAGTSGGITWLGLAASAAGGGYIGIIAWLLMQAEGMLYLGSAGPAATASGAALYGTAALLPLLLMGTLAGLLGSLCDSWLGAVCQVMYRCGVCGRNVEIGRHCGADAVKIRGLAWMTNDAVNLLSSAAGGAAALLLSFVFARIGFV